MHFERYLCQKVYLPLGYLKLPTRSHDALVNVLGDMDGDVKHQIKQPNTHRLADDFLGPGSKTSLKIAFVPFFLSV